MMGVVDIRSGQLRRQCDFNFIHPLIITPDSLNRDPCAQDIDIWMVWYWFRPQTRSAAYNLHFYYLLHNMLALASR